MIVIFQHLSRLAMMAILILVLQPSVGVTQEVAPSPAKAEATGFPSSRAALLEELVNLPDHAARRDALMKLLVTPGLSDEMFTLLNDALAVIGGLEENNRNDRTVVRLFLHAVLFGDADTRLKAFRAAREGGDPPIIGGRSGLANVGVTADPIMRDPASSQKSLDPGPPLPRLSGEARIEALKEYRCQRLVRDSYTFFNPGGTFSTVYVPPSVHTSWTVFDGGGAPLNSHAFMTLAGDSDMLVEVNERQNALKRRGVRMLVVGSLIMVGGPIAMITETDDGEIIGALVGMGGAVVSSLSARPLSLRRRLNNIAAVYTPQEADQLIDAYNRRLREKLQLTAEDVQSIDLDKSSRRFRLQIAPYFALNMAGVHGEF